MTIRPLRPADIPILKDRASQSGYPYPSPDDSELTLVVLSDDGTIITAAAAHRIIELYLWPMTGTPATKLQAIRLLHAGMAEALRKKGYNEANAQLPPAIAAKFSNRLRRSFGWARNTWENWFIRF